MAEKHVAEVLEHAPKVVKGNKLLVLWRMAAYANDERLVWVSVDTLIAETRASQTAVYEALSWLRDAGILQEVDESTLPEWMRRYPSTVRRITEPEMWNDLTPAPIYTFPESGNNPPESGMTPPESGKFEEFRNPESDNSDISEGLTVGSFPESGPYKDSLLSEERIMCSTSYYRPKAGRQQTKSRSSWNVQPEEDFDPRSTMSDHEDAEITGNPQRSAPRAGLRRAKPDSAMGLAWSFRDAVYADGEVYGLDAEAMRALASHIKRWMSQDGQTPATIRSMIELFVADPQYRGNGMYAWRAFVRRYPEMASRIAADGLAGRSRTHDMAEPEIVAQKRSQRLEADDDWVDPFARRS